MKRAVCFLILSFLVRFSIAEEFSQPVLYPMPTKENGQLFVAKELFLEENGGVWFQDQHNQLQFFDGKNVLPYLELNVDPEPQTVTFVNHAFWSFIGHEVYRTFPGQPAELIFSLPPGSEINKIGVSGRYVWIVDHSNFYTYQIDSKGFMTYSLGELDQYSQFSQLKINDAEFMGSRWTLATNTGLYFSDYNLGSFKHLRQFGTQPIEVIHHSSTRQELVVGALDGAHIVDLTKAVLQSRKILDRKVLSLAETPKGYWIGTDSSLSVFAFEPSLNGELKEILQFSGQHIYSLMNTAQGDMWVASDSGIYYFSEFSHYFNRLSNFLLNEDTTTEKFVRLRYFNQKNTFWLITTLGLYKLQIDKNTSKTLFYGGNVNDIIEHNGKLWVATDEGIISIDGMSGTLLSDRLPSFLKSLTADLLAIDHHGRIWGASEQRIWRFEASNGEFIQYGSEWMTNGEQGGRLLHINVDSDDRLILGTDHGIYVLDNGQVDYIIESQQFGPVVSITEIEEGLFGVAGRYGAFLIDIMTLNIKSLSLVSKSIVSNCLTSNRHGIWLSSAIGLTRYSLNGQLLQHFGEPFGLLNHELQASFCAAGISNNRDGILLGATYDLIVANAAELAQIMPPQTKLFLSEVKINQSRYSLGAMIESPHAKFGDILSFKFGMLPQSSSYKLQYRLSGNDNWIELSGLHLTFVNLLPGHYVIEVKAVINGVDKIDIQKIVFSIDVPWYIGGYAISCYGLIFFVLVVSLINWRSRITVKTNKILKSQVALKTNQLRHQSRILLTNNEHLRKQLQVRRILYRQLIEALKGRIDNFSSKMATEDKKGKQQLYRYVNHELDLLLNFREVSSSALPAYNLSLIVKSVLDAWREELQNADLSIKSDLEQNKDTYVAAYISNLDRVFNLLIDNLIRRSVKGQVIYMTYRHEKENVIFSMVEQVHQSDDLLACFSEVWNEIGTLVMESGGTFRRYNSGNSQLTEFSWPKANQFEENTITQLTDTKVGKQWIKKLQDLVVQNYSDSDFGTAAAAKQMYMSERSLQRRFKLATERTFTDYLTEIRLDYACRHLLAGQKVSDVAFECGFNDPSYFSQRFKHRFGVSPTQFVEARG
ncbi:AraC family transcriptional regulator [Vibrio hepatarius]|uniref:AraC family transcriptional regulator n=1 Tax=Vibrio hepatarius TaxID=171383 RepID=UPI001C0A6680|nr:helix-turn-helix domain-containing protein [Vibrio hepatarius]